MKISPQKNKYKKNEEKEEKLLTKICKHTRSQQQMQQTGTNLKLTSKEIDIKCEQLYKQAELLKIRRKQMSQKHLIQKQKQELRECTFKPKINQNLEYYIPPTPFLKREKDWIEEKTKKLEQKKRQLSMEQIEQSKLMLEKNKKKTHKYTQSTIALEKLKNSQNLISIKKVPQQKFKNTYVNIFKKSIQNKLSGLNFNSYDKNEQKQEGSTQRDQKESCQKIIQKIQIAQQEYS